MDLDEEKLKHLMNKNITDIDEDSSLDKVLSDGKKVAVVKDVAGVFVGWVWVLFLGFGASLYSAKRQYDKHHAAKKTATKKTNTMNEDKEDQRGS
ncbi:hypothetical protein D210916BOD24_33950 [Alteromonas sp. D210916BOD_24]|uniref:hypothetical protein n=1 Tax=Alteromonas sp. D210916BOD_24 TaxID=3157618 RepID=UPI00399D0917